MNLYHLTMEAQQLYELLQQEEIDEQTYKDTLEAIGADKMLEECCKMYRQFLADEAAYKAEKEYFETKKLAATMAKERLKKSIIMYMQAAGQSKTTAGDFKLSMRPTEKINIIDEQLIPQKYITTKEAKDISKSAIKDAIKKGETVPGAEIITGTSLTVK